jgi:uncharacterized protein YlxW (UPF0749 family)
LEAPVNSANAVSKIELDHLKLISDLTDVTGEGIIITLNDAEAPEEGDPSNYVIHDREVRRVLNELKVAGALAISINNERIIATSELICAGPTIKINNNRYAVPYVIKAVGDPDALYSALSESITVQDLLSMKKRVTITKEKEIQIPKFANDINGLISKLEVIDDESKKSK